MPDIILVVSSIVVLFNLAVLTTPATHLSVTTRHWVEPVLAFIHILRNKVSNVDKQNKEL